MSTIDQLKEKWGKTQAADLNPGSYDQAGFEKIVRSRVRKHTNTAMQYFWASFALQIIVYALLGHVIAKYWQDTEAVLFSVAGIFLFLPFTIMLMKKFKGMAVVRPDGKNIAGNSGTSLFNYVSRRLALLQSFYKFKKWYELILIPLASALGVFLTFKLYVPGGVQEHWTGAIITFAITLISCAAAIRSENRKNFEQPLQQLNQILAEFKAEE